jgi:hypothetical protein
MSVSACGLISTLANFLIMEKVNEMLPKDEQLGALGWYFSKTLRLHREYRRLYPEGHLVSMVRLLMALMIVCLLICGWGFGFLQLGASLKTLQNGILGNPIFKAL